MPLVTKSQIIVLHLTKYGDSGVIVHVVDSLSGRQSLYLRGIKKSKNNAVLSYFHNLNVLEAVTASSPNSSLSYLREYEPLFSLEEIRSDVYKRTIALFISEVIYRSMTAENGDLSLFKWLVESIVSLNNMDGPISNYHLWWLTVYCCKMGFRPNDNYSSEREVFDIQTAQFTMYSSYNSQILTFGKENSELLHKLLNSDIYGAMSLPLSSSRRKSYAQNMIDYLSYHLGIQINIKSLNIFHDIFN
ncbi:MAG: DNA repair protein RecO [Bacteroidales bacterium]|nr:DNA repair protein RecO [Bacteroidales bacterium]MDD4670951.1 DNA repair protein RecO [Bacteroidales bacterium]